MAEIEMGYSRNDFPFAGIFEDVTEVATQQSFSPVEAYVWYQKERVERGLNPGPDYCSTPITNCGHARRDDLTSLETIQKNTETGQRMLAELAREGILHAKSAILPADLGYVPGWSQVDYMTLWLSVIGAPDLDLQETNHNAGLYESALAQSLNNREVDLELMGNRAISAEERAGEYFKFAGAFTDVFARLDKEPHPVHRIISLPDSKESLGCRTERVFGHTQGVPTYEVVTAGPIRSPLAAIGDLALRDDLEIIVSFGGSSVELLADNAMALKERPHERVL